ncbi:MAG: cobaltochelatase subunit CobN [Eubacteriaceae bacterium]|nr:cobaltochelatase subunit CobN [Eubacteriaceae bacterium]
MSCNIVFINQHSSDSAFYGQVAANLEEAYPGQFKIKSYECAKIDNDDGLLAELFEYSEGASLTYMDFHSGVTHFRAFKEYMERFGGKKPIFARSGMEGEIEAIFDTLSMGIAQYSQIDRYIRASGVDNYMSMILYSANEFCNRRYDAPEPFFGKWQCLYTPEGPVADPDRYLDAAKASGKLKVGVLVHEHKLRGEDMSTTDAIYEGLIDAGAFPIVLVSNVIPPENTEEYPLAQALERFFMEDGKPIINTLVNTTGMSVTVLSSPGDGSTTIEGSIFEPLGVPVIQAMTTYYTYGQWRESLAGLDSMMLSSNVYQPEFDGQMTSFPCCTREVEETQYGERVIFVPIMERVAKLCKLAVNWAKLRDTPASEKKVAIIFHNIPPRNDTIGCAYGLDTPVSVYNMVNALKDEGISVDYNFEDGADIIDKIINGLSNDGRWLPEEEVLERAVDFVPANLYKSWFDEFSDTVQAKMVEDWGEPPGEFMAVGGKIPIPGIINGNIFIGLQPPRAFEEKAEEAYHSTDFVCPHQYIAYYHWIERVFKADVIVHVGTHGTIEWLPGKEIALSESCYPDLAIGTMPHLYVYNISIMGEGMQAKRRSYATLIGHMIPSFVPSGVYEELSEMDDLIDNYYKTRQSAPARLPIIYEQIWELAVELKLDQDLAITEKPGMDSESMDAFVEAMHLWISNIKAFEIKDGLHILGQVQEGERFSNLCRLISRVRNGDVPSLRESICEIHGYDLEFILANPASLLEGDLGKTNRMLLEDIDGEGQAFINKIAENGYLPGCVDLFDSPMQKELASFICGFLAPNLKRITDEIGNFVKGVKGEFIPPGPSGSPSRGKASVLPTGRNFYSVDPGAIPSRTAYRVGSELARQVIDRELADSGKYPESVAIVVYAGDTMKTMGEDLAEALNLMGIRPVWLGNTDRVIGMETIPIEELGRPRIDAVLRISGLFRDTFPNLIERIEDAVNLAAASDEPHNMNYVRKHIDEEIAQMAAEGMSREQAYERASARVFGCPPGTYGAGVDTLVQSKKWNDSNDLGNIYITWSGHAYTRKLHGDKYQDQFATRLSKTTVTIKNIASVESDMIDDDDYYIYHGGLIAAVKASSGSLPASYSTQTGDVDHIETYNLTEDTARVMRGRINNPKWIEGLKQHGYKGAQEISHMVEFVFGWSATADNIDKWMYDAITQRYVLDDENREWMKEVNPWAVHAIVERLLEAAQRGMWEADEDMLEKLREIYIEAEGAIEEAL